MLRFNFAELKESKFEKYVRPDIIFLVFVLVCVLAVDYFIENSLQVRLEQLDKKIVLLKKGKIRLRKIRKEVSRLEKLRKELKHRLLVVAQLEKGRQVPYYLYFFGNPKFVNNIWLSELVSKGSLLKIEGGTLKLNNLPKFIGDIENNLGRVLFKDTRRVNLDKLNLEYYNFNFRLELKNGAVR